MESLQKLEFQIFRIFTVIPSIFYLNENCHHLLIMQNDRTNGSGKY